MKKLWFAFLLVFVGLTASTTVLAQEDTTAYEADLSSPYTTVVTHLKFLQDESYRPELSAQTIFPNDYSEQQREELAIKLKQIYDGRGEYIEVDDLPKSPDYRDSSTNKSRYYILAHDRNIYLERYNGQWHYSRKTCKLIEEMHAELFPYGTDLLLKILPKHGHKKVMGLYLSQILGLVILIAFGFLFHKLLTFISERVIIRLFMKFGKWQLAHKVIEPIAKPVSLFIVFSFITILLPALQLPPKFSHYLMIILKGLIPLFLMLVAYKLVDLLSLYMEKLAAKTESTLDDQLIPLVRKALKGFVIIAGVLLILQTLDFDITALIAGISIGGLAFALASQDTIKNLFGSLMIFLDRPFQIGDWVTGSGGGIDGTVEEVGFRSTRIRTFRNSLTYVPNGQLADMTVDNHGLRNFRRFYTRLGITYDTPPELIEAFIEGLRIIVERHPDTKKDNYHIYLNDFGGSALEIMFYIFFEVPEWGDELRSRHEIMVSIIKLSRELNVRFAFPTQTLHLEETPEKSATPDYNFKEGELNNQLVAYFGKNKLDKE